MSATELPERGAEQARERRCHWLAGLVIAVHALLLLQLAWIEGPTYDEHFYVASGYAYWHGFDFALNREHPPLLKLAMGLPLLFDPGVQLHPHWRDLLSYPGSFAFELNAPIFDRLLFLARVPMCLLTCLGALFVYTTGRKLFGATAGLMALVLFAFNPNVLAHGPLAALDMGIAVLLFWSLKTGVALLERPSWTRALGAAVAFGLANLAKSTALVLVPVLGGLALVQCLRKRSLAPAGWALASALGGLSVFAAGYGFEAKSAWQAWADAEYKTELREPRREPSTEEIVALARQRALPEAELAALAKAPLGKGALDGLVQLALAEPAERSGAALRALADWRNGPSELRKRAFERLAFAEAVPGGEPARLAALSGLADIELPTLAAARAFYAREQANPWNRVLFTQGWVAALRRALGDRRPIPLFSALKGLDYQLYHAHFGHGSYFRGETIQPGKYFANGNPHPEYFTWVMGIKNPLITLALFALGLALCWKRAPEWTLLRALAVVGTPLVLFYVFSTGSALLGVRYVLPVFPFLCVLAGRLASLWPRVGLGLALVAAAEGVWMHPDHLMYYNAAVGGARGGPEISVVGDDWGQDVRKMGALVARNRELIAAAGGLYYDPYTVGDPAAFGLGDALPVRGPVRGLVAVHAVNYYREAKEYAFLRDYEPFARVGHAVWIFDTRGPAPGGQAPAGWRD